MRPLGWGRVPLNRDQSECFLPDVAIPQNVPKMVFGREIDFRDIAAPFIYARDVVVKITIGEMGRSAVQETRRSFPGVRSLAP